MVNVKFNLILNIKGINYLTFKFHLKDGNLGNATYAVRQTAHNPLL